MDEQSAADGQRDERYVRNHSEMKETQACKDPSDVFKRLKMSHFTAAYRELLNAVLIMAEFHSTAESTDRVPLKRSDAVKFNFICYSTDTGELKSLPAQGPSEKPRLNPFPVARLRQQHARQRKDEGAAEARALSAAVEKRHKENRFVCVESVSVRLWIDAPRSARQLDPFGNPSMDTFQGEDWMQRQAERSQSLCSAKPAQEEEEDLAGQAFPAAQCRDLLIGPSAFLADLAGNWLLIFTWKGEEGFQEEKDATETKCTYFNAKEASSAVTALHSMNTGKSICLLRCQPLNELMRFTCAGVCDLDANPVDLQPLCGAEGDGGYWCGLVGVKRPWQALMQLSGVAGDLGRFVLADKLSCEASPPPACVSPDESGAGCLISRSGPGYSIDNVRTRTFSGQCGPPEGRLECSGFVLFPSPSVSFHCGPSGSRPAALPVLVVVVVVVVAELKQLESKDETAGTCGRGKVLMGRRRGTGWVSCPNWSLRPPLNFLMPPGSLFSKASEELKKMNEWSKAEEGNEGKQGGFCQAPAAGLENPALRPPSVRLLAASSVGTGIFSSWERRQPEHYLANAGLAVEFCQHVFTGGHIGSRPVSSTNAQRVGVT
ncbi:hypothetical protein Q8A73_011210 [Channa argus]|nr:hypothetical protein Q8A73_011210 [Channa argus]